MKKLTLTIEHNQYINLYNHLFPGDSDEHGAVLSVGISEDKDQMRLLVRDLFLAQDGIDYVPGTRGYRALTAQFVAEKASYCASEKLGYLAVHCHGGTDSVGFSEDDLNSQNRGYQALMDITEGGPVGALVFAQKAVAGRVWFSNGEKIELESLSVVGSKVFKLYPKPQDANFTVDPVYDRSARLFGDVGQEVLAAMKVGIIGLGGAGSLLNEWLARLGVGTIIAADFDKIETTNLSRVVGSTRWDAKTLLTRTTNPKFLRRLGEYFSKYKVYIAERVAKQARPKIKYFPLKGNIVDRAIAEKFKNLDFIFLAADSMQSRLVFNALVHQYLIPGVQLGAKVSVNRDTKKITDIFTVTRIVMPFQGGGCLYCHELISPSKLQEESLTPEEKRSQRYVDSDEVKEPSVITLNVLASSQAINDFMMVFTGLYQDGFELPYIMQFVKERQVSKVEPYYQENCLHCSFHRKSVYAKGDRTRLPCRENNSVS